MTRAIFSILDWLADSDKPRLCSPTEVRIFLNELEAYGGFQILAWKREAEHGGQVEFVVTYVEKK